MHFTRLRILVVGSVGEGLFFFFLFFFLCSLERRRVSTPQSWVAAYVRTDNRVFLKKKNKIKKKNKRKETEERGKSSVSKPIT